jgi:hypothetical protein
LGVGRQADELFCIKIIVAKPEEVKTGSNLAECSKEDFDTKRADLTIMAIRSRSKKPQ